MAHEETLFEKVQILSCLASQWILYLLSRLMNNLTEVRGVEESNENEDEKKLEIPFFLAIVFIGLFMRSSRPFLFFEGRLEK